jgi:hypothetical protein
MVDGGLKAMKIAALEQRRGQRSRRPQPFRLFAVVATHERP